MQRFTIPITACLLCLLALACTSDPAAPVTSPPEVTGETTLDYKLPESPVHNSDGSELPPITLCGFTTLADTVAIVHVDSDETWVPVADDCSGPYGFRAVEFDATLVHHIAGPNLGESVRLVGNATDFEYLHPIHGSLLLVGVRQAQGTTFVRTHLEVAVVDESGVDTAPPSEQANELPVQVEELSSETAAVLSNFSAMCPDLADRRQRDSANPNALFSPAAFGCVPGEGNEIIPADEEPPEDE